MSLDAATLGLQTFVSFPDFHVAAVVVVFQAQQFILLSLRGTLQLVSKNLVRVVEPPKLNYFIFEKLNMHSFFFRKYTNQICAEL